MFVSDAQNAAYASNAVRGVSVSTSNFQKDPAIRCLSEYWRPGLQKTPDPAHDAELRKWIDANVGKNVETPDFLILGDYLVQRRLALKALGIDCSNGVNQQPTANLCQPAK